MRKGVTADELIWMIHEELRAYEGLETVGIAIVPGSVHGWRALASKNALRRIPELSNIVAKIEKRLQKRYSIRKE